ncbi:MAG: flagellar biosynthesis protein FlhB [Oscillospiraceae bacterium]|nr:flagellar biosynthesis protein FlhB [Oscillospiraceae bacterium]
MGDSGGGQEKTEKATQKKRRDAREKEGNVLQSREITTAASIFFVFSTLFIAGQYMFQMMMSIISESVDRVRYDHTTGTEFLMRLYLFGIEKWALTIAPLLAVAVLVPVIVGAIQTKGLFTMKPLRPRFSKLNPITGVKRLFSWQTVVNVLKGLIVIFVVSIIVYNRIRANIIDYQRMLDMELGQSVVYIARTTFNIIILILLIIVFVAAGDYLFQWWQYEKKLKMSKQEVKDEYKQIEGDPIIKSKIKQKQREIAQQRMMEQVPGADVIVRNPTHYAVALTYDKENTLVAPKVAAKGKDALALKIIKIGEENDVYITENRQLARELYETVEVGTEIPPSMYNAIAIVLTDMYTAKGISMEK